MKTFTPSQKDLKIGWTFIDAEGKILGRLAADVSSILQGKTKATYTTNINVGDKVVITNASKIGITGKKKTDKVYQWHTGFPGGIKEESLEKLMARKPTEALRKAISGMLPKNKLHKVRMANLYIYEQSEHPHQGQQKGATQE